MADREPDLLLREEIGDDVAVDVGQASVNAVVAESEFLVVDAEQVEDRGVKVVAVGRFDGFPGPFIAFAVGRAGLNTRAGEPGDKCAAVMVAAGAALAEGHAAKFGGP